MLESVVKLPEYLCHESAAGKSKSLIQASGAEPLESLDLPSVAVVAESLDTESVADNYENPKGMSVMKELTARQAEVLAWIKKYWAKHGISPSFQEIGDGMKIASSSAVSSHLDRLEAKGRISRKGGTARSIRVLDVGP